jgi:hypothetical protein
LTQTRIGRLILKDEKQHCVGGDKCGDRNLIKEDPLYIDLPGVCKISNIIFFADDNVGSSIEGHLDIYVGKTRIARNVDIRQAGSKHDINANWIEGNIIEFRSTTDDENVIHWIRVYGECR